MIGERCLDDVALRRRNGDRALAGKVGPALSGDFTALGVLHRHTDVEHRCIELTAGINQKPGLRLKIVADFESIGMTASGKVQKTRLREHALREFKLG
jgi:hypothetical protein